MRRLPADRLLPGEADVALGRLVDAGDHVEDGRLAGAVGPDHADDLALGDAQLELGQRAQAAERERQLVELEQSERQATYTTSTRR